MKTLLLLGALALAPSAVLAAPPVIDGNLDDFISFGQGLAATGTGFFAALVDKPNLNGDPQPENIYSDAKFIPCPLVNGLPPALFTHWANGTEILNHYVAYEGASTTLFIGLRTEGAIGDVDGDEDPDLAGSGAACNPQDNIEESPGISGNELYEFRFDLNCDGVPDAILRIVDNVLVGTGLFAGVTGTFAYRANAAVGADGHELEIALSLPASLPPAFSYMGVLTNAFDGLTEDRADGVQFIPESSVALSAAGTTFCPGEKGRVSSTLSNTGQTSLSVVFTHELPVGFGYALGLTTNCGAGEPQVDGQKLTFGPITLGAGAACTLEYDVSSPLDCSGEAAVALEAAWTFRSPCLESGEQSEFVSATATLLCDPIPCAPEGTCRLTGGGCLNEEGDRRGHKQNTFGGNSSPAHDGGGPTGNSWEHILRDGRETLFNWHSWDAHVIGCSVVGLGPCHPAAENTRADFVGTGRYSIGAGGRSEPGNMVAYVIDHNEGACNRGSRDEYGITVRKGTTIGEGDIVFETSGEIDCGNLQIHETPARLFGNDVRMPAVQLLNRAYPNPFSATTSFAYVVAEGSMRVDVGVYNVAGRLVKTLASGSQPAGAYTVTWDGSDESGVRMAPGVYFLKSRVGGEQVVNRLIYVAQ